MRVLVIGSGGREHCLAWKLKQDSPDNEVYCITGNAGITKIGVCEKLPISAPFGDLTNFAKEKNIDLTIVGPEAPLVDGIVEEFEAKGLRVFGPSKQAAQMEGSKWFAKDIMFSAGVPTGQCETFEDANLAITYLDKLQAPYVVKADGLAAGKGVSIIEDKQAAAKHIHQVMDEGLFGDAGKRVIVEEFLEGEEASVLAFTDGETILQMESAQDHKPIGEGDSGPNTGGMGAYSPAPVVTPELADRIFREVLRPTVAELQKRGIRYKGILYAGLMMTKQGPKVIEFNCRFGDPETQALLPRLKTNLADLACAVAENRLSEMSLEWRHQWAVCVIAASGGYPGKYSKGLEITGLDAIEQNDETIVFHAGTTLVDGKTVTAGGRVLGLTTLGNNIGQTIRRNYSLLDKIRFDGIYYRRDIGNKIEARD